mgnify:CR=1 FL=1
MSGRDVKAYEEALRHFHRVDRPVFLGELSLVVGMSLRRTEDVLRELVEGGHVRPATREELSALGVDPTATEAHVLTRSASMSLAHRP